MFGFVDASRNSNSGHSLHRDGVIHMLGLRLSKLGLLCVCGCFDYSRFYSSPCVFLFCHHTSHTCHSNFVVSWGRWSKIWLCYLCYLFSLSVVVISLLLIFFVHSEILERRGFLLAAVKGMGGAKEIFEGFLSIFLRDLRRMTITTQYDRNCNYIFFQQPNAGCI